MAKLNFIKPTGNNNTEQGQSTGKRLTFIESTNPKPETAPAVKTTSQIEEEARRRNYAAEMQQRDRENAALRQLAEETVAGKFYHNSGKFDVEPVAEPITHNSGKIDQEETEKESFWRRLFPRMEEIAKANAVAAQYQAREYADDNITPIEAAALGAAKLPTSIGTGIGKGISKITGNEDGGRRLNDFYSDVSEMQQKAQQEKPIAYGAGDMAASLALMGGISSGLGAVKGFENFPRSPAP